MPSDADLDAIMDRSKMMAQASPPTPAAHVDSHSHAATANGKTHVACATSSSATLNSAPLCDGRASSAEPAVASTSVEGDVPSAAAMMLVDSKHDALSFNAEQAPMSTFLFGGLDYKALRAQGGTEGESLHDIAKQVGWDM